MELVPGSVFPAVGIDACDIYTILSNAIDNAIEATEKVEENKTVTVESRIKAGTVYLRISNPYSGKLRTEKGELITTKEKTSSHGYGFRSIKKTAAKYGSDNVSFKAENGIFRLSVELKIPKKNGQSEE